ncbi:MAG TPA: hypothetical protein VJ123_03775 [Anaerolineales bacterium]|nr:hypothetical protein [Anaerolineales bacterium]
MTNGERVGQVIHFFDKIGVAILRLSKDLKIGDHLHFHGAHTDFEETVSSMQVEHQPVEEVKAGGEVALKVTQKAREGDAVYRLPEQV